MASLPNLNHNEYTRNPLVKVSYFQIQQHKLQCNNKIFRVFQLTVDLKLSTNQILHLIWLYKWNTQIVKLNFLPQKWP